MDIQSAVSLPHLVDRFGTYDIEEGTPAEKLAAPLENLGYKVRIRPLNSGLHGIAITADSLVGGADPRREGTALGQ
jgi:gamma-glutamyltranspeptidase/glutathione hydrolase